MKRVTVYTEDLLLYRRLLLWFSDVLDFRRLTALDTATAEGAVIVDADTCPTVEGGDVFLTRSEERLADFSRHGTVAFLIPFSFEDIENALQKCQKSDTGRLVLLENERAARLDGVTVRLTDVEYRLLRVLLSVPVGEYVSKQKIVAEVWGEGVDGGVVNVYVHYLREKLEKNGEKIIISSRNLGYKINERTVTLC
ncbi:MAG: winged helix-turn-helix transcriptional regulator [Clostridia bacterium]|nr:winged helix-turn-helix transcriptional regulator [Clostridia bacterium]